MEINDAYEKFVTLMWDNAKTAVKKAIDINYQVITAEKLTSVIKSVLPGVPVYCADNRYQITSIDTWKKIIKFDWTSRKKYVTDYFDCDNFSDAFRAHACEMYDLNSAGAMTCGVDSADGKLVNMAHRAVMIVALDEKDVPSVYAYESQNENFVKVEAGKAINIPTATTIWKYNPVATQWN